MPENITMKRPAMPESHYPDGVEMLDQKRELEALYAENARLKATNREVFTYIRSKVDNLLSAIGTNTLKPEELDDQSLIEFDPIGIVTETFHYVLENVRETNQKLKFAHDELQAVFDTIGASILVLDMQGKVVAYNQKTRDILIDDGADIVGKSCQESICGSPKHESLCMFQRVSKRGIEQHIHNWALGCRCFDVVGRPMFDENGEICNIVISYSDVSARRDAEAAMSQALLETQQANAKLRGILRSVADSVLVTDAAGKIVMINRRAEELFVLSSSARQPLLDIDCLPQKDLVDFLRSVAGQKQEFWVKDFVFCEAAGKEHIYQARTTVVNAGNGGFQGCLTILHEVTEEREIDRMKSEFVSTAAHELRTPLATIIGYTDLLLMRDDWRKSEQRDYLELIQQKADHLGDIVSDLLDISRIESGEGLRLDLQPCRLDVLSAEVLKSFQSQSDTHEFVNQVAMPTEIRADRFAVRQILENIIGNAVKYSPRGGVIRVSAHRVDGLCQCSVSDEGIGMSTAQRARVFDKFYRADATDTAVSGTGLGLTIVKYLVEAQGGQVRIESNLGSGSTVSFLLSYVD